MKSNDEICEGVSYVWNERNEIYENGENESSNNKETVIVLYNIMRSNAGSNEKIQYWR